MLLLIKVWLKCYVRSDFDGEWKMCHSFESKIIKNWMFFSFLVVVFVDPDHSDSPLGRVVRSAYGGGGGGGLSGSAANAGAATQTFSADIGHGGHGGHGGGLGGGFSGSGANVNYWVLLTNL